MEGIQQTVAEGLETLARWVREGRYGFGDDFDAESLGEDFENEVIWKSE